MLTQLSPPLWKKILRQNFTDWHLLADFLALSEAQRSSILTRSRFPLNLPLRLAAKIEKGTLADPLLRQFLPLQAENIRTPGFCSDPVDDELFQKTPKLLHKYQNRVLLISTSACAMHCRYCFRQNFDYPVSKTGFEKEITWIAAEPSIREVILSGGDPLSLSNHVLKSLLDQLNAIPHLRLLRFHTRFPMGIPERIDQEFLQILEDSRLQVWFVVHANHPREFDTDIFDRLLHLRKKGINVLCQSVLLRGVNDHPDILVELSELLVDHGIVPYYLHQLDRVNGASHFEVSEKEGIALIAAMSLRLPGYAVPRYVREIAGEPYKTPILTC